MHIVTRLLPALTVLLLAIAGVLPWGHGNEMRFCLPALAFLGIHYWQHRQPDLMPPTFVASVGLGIDVLTSGPFGFWALVFLAGVAITAAVDSLVDSTDGLIRWLGFVAASSGLSLVAWLIASGYVQKPVDWTPMLVSVVIQSMLYPLIAALLSPIGKWVAGPRVLILERQR